MNTETIETEEVHTAVPVPINTPIKFDITTAAIEQMKAHAATLAIAGPEDKSGYEALCRFRIDVPKAQRIDVEDRIEALIRPHLDYVKNVKAVGGELVDALKRIENEASLKEKAYKDERERLAREAMLFQQQRTEGRVNQLRAYGFEWNAGSESYVFDRRDQTRYFLEIQFWAIREMADEHYEPIRQDAYTAHKLDLERIAQQAEARRIEAERVATEEKVERNLLAAQKKALDEQAAEVKRQQDQIEADRKALEEQKSGALLKTRTAKLLEYGFAQVDDSFERPNVRIRSLYLLQYSEEQFSDILRETAEYFHKVEADRLQAIRDDAEALRLRTLAEKEKRKADKERVARLKPDKKEINLFFTRLLNTKPWPLMDELETIDFMADAYDRIRATVDVLRAELDAL